MVVVAVGCWCVISVYTNFTQTLYINGRGNDGLDEWKKSDNDIFFFQLWYMYNIYNHFVRILKWAEHMEMNNEISSNRAERLNDNIIHKWTSN